jgi:hypothetical protein
VDSRVCQPRRAPCGQGPVEEDAVEAGRREGVEPLRAVLSASGRRTAAGGRVQARTAEPSAVRPTAPRHGRIFEPPGEANRLCTAHAASRRTWAPWERQQLLLSAHSAPNPRGGSPLPEDERLGAKPTSWRGIGRPGGPEVVRTAHWPAAHLIGPPAVRSGCARRAASDVGAQRLITTISRYAWRVECDHRA